MSNDPETAKAAIVVGVGSRGRDTARLLAATTRDNTQHCTICGLDTYESQLEAAKQRELELLAVIEKQRDVLYMVDEEYCETIDPRIMETMTLIVDDKALREHEAKIVAEYKQRAEAAEAKLRELEMQEPIWWRHEDEHGRDVFMNLPFGLADEQPLYAKPFPTPKQEEK